MDDREARGGAAAPCFGILLDLWNTLVFTDHSPHPIAVLAETFGLAGPEGLALLERAIMTRPLTGISAALDELVKVTGRELDITAHRDMVMQWSAACNFNRLYPDAIPAVRALSTGPRRCRVGILSNTQSFDLDILRREGLDTMMDAVRLSCHTGILKPDAAAFHDAAEHLGVPPERCVMVGDRTVEDIEGARRAGLRACLIARPPRTMPSDGVTVIGSLAELPALLGRISAGASAPGSARD